MRLSSGIRSDMGGIRRQPSRQLKSCPPSQCSHATRLCSASENPAAMASPPNLVSRRTTSSMSCSSMVTSDTPASLASCRHEAQ